jgi:peptidoglycan/xylan/chitin deacetylase (PgdA/CDA1 family)
MQLALRVDVDTRIGLREGVPRLLDLFQRYGVRASFFISFGPDRSGRALRRLLQPGFLSKMWRTNPLRLYGLSTLLSGTFLPSRPIGEGEPALLKTIVTEKHELGIHGYDHVYWQDRLEKMKDEEIAGQMTQSIAAYERLLKTRPVSSAAPGWRCTSSSLALQDRLNFLYASDVRGSAPFVPVGNGRVFKTIQIPTTLPTLDELLGREKNINEFLLGSMKEEELNVHTVHAEVEGRAHLSLFEELLRTLRRRGVGVISLREVADRILKKGQAEIPRLPVTKKLIPGRSGWVACQESATSEEKSDGSLEKQNRP